MLGSGRGEQVCVTHGAGTRGPRAMLRVVSSQPAVRHLGRRGLYSARVGPHQPSPAGPARS